MSSRNDDQNLEQPNDTGNPSTPANEAASANGDRATRSITVSIQYSYFSPNGLANLNQPNAGADGEEGTPATRPDGALILSFRDVPTSTPQERLESIISIAAELAMRRFSDLMSQSKGITKEQFEELPTVKLSELLDEQSKVCSICYESYEDEPENILKRSRDDDFGDRSESIKKQRSESPAVVLDPPEPAGRTTGQPTQEANGDETPTYKHSPVRLPCGHVFGRECLYKWSRLENSCPLCRHKIVEAAPGNSENSNEEMANLNADAFERIRQALYNTQQPDATEGAANDTTNETNNAAEPSDLQNFTFSRSGIVFLRPDGMIDPSLGQQATATGEAGSSEQTSPAANPGIGGIPGFNPFAAGNAENHRRIQWIPLPITTLQTGSNALNSDSNNSNSNGANPDGSEGIGGRQTERTPNERLRAILSNIFSHSANTVQNNDEGGVSTAANNPSTVPATPVGRASPTDDRQPNSNARIPRRRSFLDHILRITNRHRSRNNNGSPRTDTQPSFHSANSMFNSGVASYRNQDGQVSTFNVTDGQLPTPPQADRSEQSNAGPSGSGSQAAQPRANNGEPSSDNNDNDTSS